MVAEIVARLVGGAILATGGWRLGEYISEVWGPELYVPWVLGLTALGLAIGLAAAPYLSVRLARNLVSQIESIPTSRLLSTILGGVLGLLVALLLSIPLSRIPGWLGLGLPVALSVLLAYIGAYLLSRGERDVFAGVLPDDGAGGGGKGGPDNILLDTSAIIDGRIADITQTGFLRGTIVIPSFILDELRHIADSSDSLRRARGRRGLEMLNKLRQETEIPIRVLDISYHNGLEVDSKLVEVAKEMNGFIVTTDYNLNRVAQIQGVPVLNVNELSNALKPVVLPGEGMTVRVIQEGKEPGQGVGFLDDGTMVVVEGGSRFVNRDMDVLVTRMLQTATGSIVFAQPKRG
ncbi:MAG: PIN domain nuclease [Chloroflexi bacterium]|nr:PIN domain nuclease [Chloroflexota bacterium]